MRIIASVTLLLSLLLLTSCKIWDDMMADLTGSGDTNELKTGDGNATATVKTPSIKFDPKSLEAQAFEKVAVKNPKVGQMAQLGTAAMAKYMPTYAIVGKKDGLFIYEVRMATPKNAVLTFLIDKDGNAKKAYAGLAGTIGVEIKLKKMPTGLANKMKTKDLGTKDIKTKAKTFKAKGVEMLEGAAKGYKSWTSVDFPFMGGLVRSENAAGKVGMEVLSFGNDAKQTLTLPVK